MIGFTFLVKPNTLICWYLLPPVWHTTSLPAHIDRLALFRNTLNVEGCYYILLEWSLCSTAVTWWTAMRRPGVQFPVGTVYLSSFTSFARDSKWGLPSLNDLAVDGTLKHNQHILLYSCIVNESTSASRHHREMTIYLIHLKLHTFKPCFVIIYQT